MHKTACKQAKKKAKNQPKKLPYGCGSSESCEDEFDSSKAIQEGAKKRAIQEDIPCEQYKASNTNWMKATKPGGNETKFGLNRLPQYATNRMPHGLHTAVVHTAYLQCLPPSLQSWRRRHRQVCPAAMGPQNPGSLTPPTRKPSTQVFHPTPSPTQLPTSAARSMQNAKGT